jgi:hypothetical protein
MVHCGYEPTAVNDTISRPLRALKVSLLGPRTDGPMAAEIRLDRQRPAEFVFEGLVQRLTRELEQGAGAKSDAA